MSNIKDMALQYDAVQTLGRKKKYPGHADADDEFRDALRGKSEREEFNAALRAVVDKYNSRPLQRGEEPDTKSAIGLAYEKSGIHPAGWYGVNPYDTEKYPLTQVGFSKLFAAWSRGRLWYEPAEKLFYIRDHGIPQADMVGRLMLALRDEFQEALEYAASLIQDNAYRKEFEKNREKYFCEDKLWNKALMGVQPHCAVESSESETPKYMIATQSQMIKMNRENGSYAIEEISSDGFTPRRMNVIHDPNADCPTFKQVLADTFEGNREKIEFFQMMLGMGLSGDNEQKAVLILHGRRANNGKSTILKAVEDVLGNYAFGVREGVIDKKTHEGQGASSDAARIKGQRYVILREMSESVSVDSGKLKRLVGNDHTTVRQLFEATESFVPQCLIIMDCNTLPALDDMSLFDRESLFVITFERSFNGENRDTSIARMLEKEHAGILNWILEGFRMYCKRCSDYSQIKAPECVREDTLDYRYEYDHISEFFNCNLEYTGDSKDRILVEHMRKRYDKWTKDNGYTTFSTQRFNSQLVNLVHIDSKSSEKFKIYSNSKVYYRGFRFRITEKADPSGFTTYLETEYQKTNATKDHENVLLTSLFSGYNKWADEQGICDKIDFYDTVSRLDREKYHILVEGDQIFITDIEKIAHDSDINCESNQLAM